MPQKAKRPCTYPGCNELVLYGRCEKHRKQINRQYDQQRGTATQRGYDSRWRRAREQYLKENPLCVECLKEGHITPATVIDHIVPHKGDPVLFWDKGNWQSLCKRHHDIKTAKEDGGFGKLN